MWNLYSTTATKSASESSDGDWMGMRSVANRKGLLAVSYQLIDVHRTTTLYAPTESIRLRGQPARHEGSAGMILHDTR